MWDIKRYCKNNVWNKNAKINTKITATVPNLYETREDNTVKIADINGKRNGARHRSRNFEQRYVSGWVS